MSLLLCLSDRSSNFRIFAANLHEMLFTYSSWIFRKDHDDLDIKLRDVIPETKLSKNLRTTSCFIAIVL